MRRAHCRINAFGSVQVPGPAVYNTTSQEWSQLALPGGKNPLILSVLADQANVWFGGAEGAWRYSVTDQAMHPVVQGLPNPYVNVLLSTEENEKRTLWAGTGGVSRA